MIGAKTTVIDNTRTVKKAADRASYENLGHAAASIRKQTIWSIRRSAWPSMPGRPPHTRRRRALPRSILYDVARDKLDAFIGPVASRVGTVGEAHEFGKEYKGQDYPERPFMGPALEENLDRIPAYWAGTVGE